MIYVSNRIKTYDGSITLNNDRRDDRLPLLRGLVLPRCYKFYVMTIRLFLKGRVGQSDPCLRSPLSREGRAHHAHKVGGISLGCFAQLGFD